MLFRSLLEAHLCGYAMVDDEDDADIIWTAEHNKDFSTYKDKYVSQYPNEWVLTTKVNLKYHYRLLVVYGFLTAQKNYL